MIKLEKNFYRHELMQLIEILNGRPFIVSGKYKHPKYIHADSLKWTTFTTIRPYAPGLKTRTICNHVNIEKSRLKLYYTLSLPLHNRKFYIIGYPYVYTHYGEERAAIRLAEDLGVSPIVIADESWYKITSETLNRCYKFSAQDFRRGD